MLLATLLFTGCSTTPGRSGFLGTTEAGPPAQQQVNGGTSQAISIREPQNKIVIVYSHGTTRPQLRERCEAPGNRPPGSIMTQKNENTLIYYLCSRATEGFTRNSAGTYVYKRMREIEGVVDELLRQGVAPRNIFLAGHSAGGWSSLMAARYFGYKFNAVIAFAPAFAGQRHEEALYPWWRREVRPRQIADMLQAPQIKALVFAYENDPYNRPRELAFLKERYPDSIEMVSYGCALIPPHHTHQYDCREENTTERISDFLVRMRY